jgi:hypothetical protein
LITLKRRSVYKASPPPTGLSQTKFPQLRETKNRALDLPREDHYKPDIAPNEVRWKNLLRRRLPNPAACLTSILLELAKGFEPPTP